ncbi:MAG TPA: LacI family DNA-binding transcriptional regulator [Roseiflexaceae bacterium]|nr:LacI family DNA-binding transcriptional regulator [Roseiflexaceae bacterium]
MATMQDVAKRAGVSLSTVSYALNGTRPISEETRQRIFAAMEELGYQPHALARGLASKRSRIIALLFPTPERGLGITELEFVTGAIDAATERGYNLVLWSSDLHNAGGLRQLMQQGLVDGVIMMEVHLQDERIDLLRENGIPFTLIGRPDDPANLSYVDIDFAQTTRDAVAYLVGLGHRRIAFLNQSQVEIDNGYGPVVRAQAGFTQAMAAVGLAGPVLPCLPTPGAGYEICAALLEVDPTMTALISINERATPGVLQALADRGWRIPDDFSLVLIVSSGRVADMSVPPLTTMTSPSAEAGRLGVVQLIQQLESGQQSAPQALLPCRLEVRGSSGPPRSG